MTLARPTLAKIIATVGPASQSATVIERLILAGAGIFRLNFSHGKLEDHQVRAATIRAVAAKLDRPVAILGDLQGPKIRVGNLPEAGVEIEPGSQVVLFPEADFAQASSCPRTGDVLLPSGYATLAADVAPGHRVLINDGAVRLLAVERLRDDPPSALRCTCIVGGLVTSKKGINLPDSDVKSSAITEQDWRCVEWAVANGLDFLALSFVRKADEVRSLKSALAGMCSIEHDHDSTGVGAQIPVIAKIEKPQALDDLDAIVEAADGIMVARGDLGVEMDLAQVPIIQKRLIAKADEWGKPCIVATQMLETMISANTPTRAEVSDVANAVLDGADAVMLSAETAAGKHPARVVETMRRVVEQAEALIAEQTRAPSPARRTRESHYPTAALAHGAWHTARDLGARLVVVWSQRGGAARFLSQTGLPIPIIAYSSDEREVRRMALLRAVTARHMPLPGDSPAERGGPSLAWFHRMVEQDLLALGWVQTGDPILILAGRPLGVTKSTNTLTMHVVGREDTGFARHH